MMPADRLGIYLQLATGRPADAGTAPQGVGRPGIAVDFDQLGEEFAGGQGRGR